MGPGGLNRTIAAGSPGAAWGTVRTVPIRAERSAAAVVSGWPQSLHRGGRLQALALMVSKPLAAASSQGASWGTVRTVPIRAERSAAAVVSGDLNRAIAAAVCGRSR